MLSLRLKLSHFVSLCLTWAHLVSLGLIGSHFVSLRLIWSQSVSLCTTWSHLKLLGLTWSHLVSLGVTWFHLVSHCNQHTPRGTQKHSLVSLVFISSHWNAHGLTCTPLNHSHPRRPTCTPQNLKAPANNSKNAPRPHERDHGSQGCKIAKTINKLTNTYQDPPGIFRNLATSTRDAL